jgi:hypothetical protein
MKDDGRPVLGSTPLECVAVMDLLREYWPADQPMHYMNIDLEGIDEDIVLAIDWEEFRPRILSVEMHRNPLHHPEQPIMECVAKAGYSLEAYSFLTGFFVDRRTP